ncbi:hypothetical protein HII28_13320 [Planctomonas sp. JC2975]|uniref:hypothetical protein n=1 Tax=Planctomonas sp. JC2975 TaxID=2729626 RepID=UPI001475E9A9|nr:hypothetical protein [Planctomonas sp. JC2975]NNC12855.1 hypothetical protein [Planctomonas sp. JC2975]
MDGAVAAMLTKAGSIATTDANTEVEKHQLAALILQASTMLPSAAVRTGLIASLSLDDWLDPAQIPVEKGELVGRLIEAKIAQDDAAAFGQLAQGDAEGRAFAIMKSKNFTSFMTPTEVPVGQLAFLIGSTDVPLAVRDEIVEQFAVFTVSANRATLTVVAEYALTRDMAVPLAEIARIASQRVSNEVIVRLLQSHLSTVTMSELVSILQAMGGEYAKLIGATGQHARLDMTAADEALAARVNRFGDVSSIKTSRGILHVYMRRPR